MMATMTVTVCASVSARATQRDYTSRAAAVSTSRPVNFCKFVQSEPFGERARERDDLLNDPKNSSFTFKDYLYHILRSHPASKLEQP